MKFPCPLSALPAIAAELRKHGAKVIFASTRREGLVVSEAGLLGFDHHDGFLEVTILTDNGHFPPQLLIGGIRQVIEEGIESQGFASTAI